MRQAGLLAVMLFARLAGAASPPVDLSPDPLGAACIRPPASVKAAASVASTPGGRYVYQASASVGDWSGTFTRAALSVDAAGAPQTSPPQWDAAAIMSATPDAAHARHIYTSRIVSGVQTTIPFEWDSLSPAQRTALNRAPPPARPVSDGKGRQRLDYLRGDRSLEGRLFRRRASLLGDAVNSTPVYVGAPSADGRGDAYQAYFDRNQSRRAAVYLGANDGMLHAFDAETGAELFAYVPDALFTILNRLPDPAYLHSAYVDGPASAADAQLAGEWRSVLVSAMGGGAQGVFALDVTNPADFARGGGALWEFTDRDDPAMGNVTTAPQIARIRLRSGGSDFRYFAVVASGVNNTADDDSGLASASNVLFLLALDKPAGEAWRLNRNYYRLQTPAGEPGVANGLSAPALVLDADGALRYAYAGDLQGKLWRFSFTGSAPWSGAAGGAPLFAARDDRGVRQPITQQPRVAFAPDGAYLILFGTGRLFGASDRDSAHYAQQSFYAVLDDGGSKAWPLGRADLQPRALAGAAGSATLAVTGRAIEYGGASGVSGWYIDFLQSGASGERSVAGATLADGKVYFNTVLTGASVCAAIASRSYVLDVLAGLAPDMAGLPATGLATGQLTGDYLPTAPLALVTEQASTARQPTGSVVVSKRIVVVNFGAAGARASGAAVAAALPTGVTRSTVTAGRIGWREVANWRELYRAALARRDRP
jgi:type IV pilus assembly protein PilY1